MQVRFEREQRTEVKSAKVGGGGRENHKLKNALVGLYPHRPLEETLNQYRLEKRRRILLILAAGVVLTVWMWGRERLERGGMEEPGSILRSNPGEGSQKASLIARMGREEVELEIEVEEKRLTREEAEERELLFWKEVELILPGGNPSLEEVWEPLELPEELEGYPFWVEWYSLDPDLISSLGNVAGDKEGRGCICARVHYEEYSWEHRVELQVKRASKSPEEERKAQLVRLLEEEEERTRYESRIQLPEVVKGQTVTWESPGRNWAGIILVLTLLLAAAIFWGMDEDLNKNWIACKRGMVKEYPMIVSKLALYLGAGMTIRGSMLRLSEGRTTRGGGAGSGGGGILPGKKRARDPTLPNIYDVIRHACHEIGMGIAEQTAYENMGRRTGTSEYIRLAGILNQSLTRGGDSLLRRLEEEAKDSMKASLEQRKKEGEEATTKLLVPMVMMLGIVMVLVILPAFGSIS